MSLRPLAGLLLSGMLLLAGPLAAAPEIEHRLAMLQGLDKVTARIREVAAPVGEEVRFGSLAVRARACLETPPTEPPESAAFLEIDELGPDESRETMFVGWMFASTPAISALEHPVYDVWVIDCREPTGGRIEGEPIPQEPPLRIDPLPEGTILRIDPLPRD